MKQPRSCCNSFWKGSVISLVQSSDSTWLKRYIAHLFLRLRHSDTSVLGSVADQLARFASAVGLRVSQLIHMTPRCEHSKSQPTIGGRVKVTVHVAK